MERFKDYNASQITPQMTLIKKFDALLKWMKENSDKFYNNVFEVNVHSNFILKYTDIENVIQTENKKVKVGDLLIFNDFAYSFVTAVANGKVYYDGGSKYEYEYHINLYKHTVRLQNSSTLSFSDDFVVLSFNDMPFDSLADLISPKNISVNGKLLSTMFSIGANTNIKFEFLYHEDYIYELISNYNYSTNTLSFTSSKFNTIVSDSVERVVI